MKLKDKLARYRLANAILRRGLGIAEQKIEQLEDTQRTLIQEHNKLKESK